MKNLQPALRALGLAGFLFTGIVFASCSTGTDSGETNVEDSGAKDVHEKSGTEKSGEGVRDNKPGADR